MPKRELPHFTVGESYGGNQDWFSDFMMRIGGCAAETACDLCVYLAKYFGKTHLYPADPFDVKKEEYVRFSEKMRPYLHPRMSGIDRTEIYTDGFGRYLEDCGETDLQMRTVDGKAAAKDAEDAIRASIEGGMPVAFLLLNHKDKTLKNWQWHWFLINGYCDDHDAFLVKAVTYSTWTWLDFKRLWDTGRIRKGGMVLFSLPKMPATVEFSL